MLISPSAPCHCACTPPGSGHRPCTAPLPRLPSKAPSREAGSGAWEEKVTHRWKNFIILKVIVLFLRMGESRREVGQGRGRQSFSKHCHSGAVILGEPSPFCCQQAGAN